MVRKKDDHDNDGIFEWKIIREESAHNEVIKRQTVQKQCENKCQFKHNRPNFIVKRENR